MPKTGLGKGASYGKVGFCKALISRKRNIIRKIVGGLWVRYADYER